MAPASLRSSAPVVAMMRRLRSREMRLQRVLASRGSFMVSSRVRVCACEAILLFKLVDTDFFGYALARKRVRRYAKSFSFDFDTAPCLMRASGTSSYELCQSGNAVNTKRLHIFMTCLLQSNYRHLAAYRITIGKIAG
jgi:hypothetical protein